MMNIPETNFYVAQFWKRLYIEHGHDYSRMHMRYVIIESKGECKHSDELNLYFTHSLY